MLRKQIFDLPQSEKQHRNRNFVQHYTTATAVEGKNASDFNTLHPIKPTHTTVWLTL